MSDQAAVDATPRASLSGGWRLWYMVAVLCSTNVVAFIDRASLPLLARQIEHDLGISDSEMGLLIGAAFVLTYFGLAIPAGALLDRFPRRPLMAAAVAVWAACTIGCGFAYSFAALFMGRIGVGAGEAFSGPGSMSLIRDAVPAEKRGRAVAIWSMGANIGAAIALLAGGAILLAIGDEPAVTLPLLGTIRSWQFVLICCGILTTPVVVLLLTFSEPPRTAAAQKASVKEALLYVGSRWPIFLPLFFVNGLTIIMTVGSGLWTPLMFGRVFHVSRPEIGFTLGLMNLCLAMPSQFVAGIVMDWLYKRGVRNPIPPLGIAVTAISLVLGIAFPLAADAKTAWTLLGAFLLIGTCTFTIGTALSARLSPPHMVGKIMALHFLWVGLMGTLVGGQLYPGVSEVFFRGAGDKAIAYSISSVIGVLGLLAVGGYIALAFTTRYRARQDAQDAVPALMPTTQGQRP